MIYQRIKLLAICILAAICIQSCSDKMTPFDQYAYTQVTSVKVDALNLMDLATEEYSTHASEIKAVKTELQKAYEYEKHRSNNEETLKIWSAIMDSSEHTFGGFIARWETKKTLKKAYIEDKKKQVDEAFDKIADLEGRKAKPNHAK
jgi:hypothetical protein